MLISFETCFEAYDFTNTGNNAPILYALSRHFLLFLQKLPTKTDK